MRIKQPHMKPQDVVVLLKINSFNKSHWNQLFIAKSLRLSQSEVSESIARSRYAGLLDPSGKKVMREAFMEFLQYGLRYVFPARPGPMVRGIPTAHSAPPLNAIIRSQETYVWPHAKGGSKGQAIAPLYPSVVDTLLLRSDGALYHLLTLVDALRVGRAREQNAALMEIKKRIIGDTFFL